MHISVIYSLRNSNIRPGSRGRRAIHGLALLGLTTTLLSAGPAAARDLNCFQWVAAKASNIFHPHPRPMGVAIHRTHRLAHAARPHATPVNMIRKPIACPSREVTLQSLAPGAAPPETADTLLAELAGPAAPPAAVGSPIDASTLAPAPRETVAAAAAPRSEVGPFFNGGGPGGFQPPVPSHPGSLPGDTGTPPIILPPDTTTTPVISGLPVSDVFPPVIVPPVVGPPTVGPLPNIPGGVPEPGVWVLMIMGFGTVGASLRRRRVF